MCGPEWTTQDKRYCRVEKSIRNTVDKMYLSGDFITKVLEFSEKAEINPASFYAHYPCIGEAIVARDRNMRVEFASFIGEIIPKDSRPAYGIVEFPGLETIFYRMFVFARQNETYFKAAHKRANISVFGEATVLIKPVVVQKWQKYMVWDENRERRIEEIFYAYSYEIVREFWRWVEKDNFSTDRILVRTKHLVRLAETACRRLDQGLE